MDDTTIESWLRLAAGHYARGEFAQALAAIERAVTLAPDDPATLNVHGAILAASGQAQAAVAVLDRALELAPTLVPALANRAMALLDLGREVEALAAFDRVIDLAPDQCEARLARADLRRRAGHLQEAMQDFDHVLAIEPAHPLALQNSATMLHMRGELEAALERFERLATQLRAVPGEAATLDYALGMSLSARRRLCAWEGLGQIEATLVDRVLHADGRFNPFLSLMVSDDPRVHALCARRSFAGPVVPRAAPLAAARRERLCIGYLGGDFRDHPTAWLIAGLLECHDRSRFEIRAYSTSPDDGSSMRRRLTRAVDAFVDVSRDGDAETARRIAADGVDILVDLSGNTEWSRIGAQVLRPAPLNVHFLGYPGPPGSPALDYFIADGVVLPRADDALYGCAIARLPHCYQVNDRWTPAAPAPPSRAVAGLPAGVAVYCGFCQPVKLTPRIFASWMEILREVPDSVLWLLDSGPAVERNLRRAAVAQGVEAARLVFAPRVDHASHLARLALADLLLDTTPCGAHTTASDALRAGVPFVTQPGRSLASRVGASVLQAAGLPELIVGSRADYVALALALGREPRRRLAMKRRVRERVPASALFDTDRFRAYLEAAFDTMWQRHTSGLAPASFDVPR